MADVPAWVLFANTVVVGSFGLASSFIVPKAQREALKQERERADAAIMRDRAAEVFREIAALDMEAATAVRIAMATANNLPITEEPVKIRGLENLRALLAVYFPKALPLIVAYDEKIIATMTPLRAQFAAATAAPMAQRAAAINAVNLEMLMALWGLIGETAKEVRAFMIEAVEPYVPMAPAKV